MFKDKFDIFFEKYTPQINGVDMLFGDEIIEIKSRLKKYSNDLLMWSKTHNIVSVKFSEKEIIENIVDSIIGSLFVDVKNPIYDIGSGGGFPGIPMAIIYPKITFYLVESDRKKCSFLRTVKSELNLSNITIKNVRIESLNNLPTIVSKAAFSPKNMFYLSDSLASGGKMALWATQNTSPEYKKEAENLGLIFEEQFPYELSSEKKRLVMIFRKG